MRVLIGVAARTILLAGRGGGATAQGGAPKRSGRLLGSGHPDVKGELPPYLGLIASDDGGQRWRGVSKLGEADFHEIVIKHGRLYAFDAALGATLISSDGGHRFVERWERVGRVPGEPYKSKALGAEGLDVALSDGTIVGTQDGGRHWETTFRP